MPHTSATDNQGDFTGDFKDGERRIKPQTFDIGHDIELGWFLDVEQDMDGDLLESIFRMIETNFGLTVVDEYANDAVILDNGNVRIWLESAHAYSYTDADA